MYLFNSKFTIQDVAGFAVSLTATIYSTMPGTKN